MRKVITYGTYDLLHYGHIRLLERAKALGDYLIVGVTAEDFDKVRGKINVKQSLMERVEAVKATGIADEVIVEEYEGQKIDDIQRYGVDVFTVGSDWVGFFDYLKEYCEVVYLDRTQGVSSTDLRAGSGRIQMGFIGDAGIVIKRVDEVRFVNGLEARCVCADETGLAHEVQSRGIDVVGSYEELLKKVDAVYIASHPAEHEKQIECALLAGKHVLCESPLVLSLQAYDCLSILAEERGLVLADSIKTAYATAYHRLKLLVKGGRIGNVVSVDASCTSLNAALGQGEIDGYWNSICAWGPTALLPIFQVLGTSFEDVNVTSKVFEDAPDFDIFTKIDFVYEGSVASAKVGEGVKTEGDLVISGTKGYVYVPAPWWKTDYFEIRFENPAENKRYFYQLNGEGIRYELLCFKDAIESGKPNVYLDSDVSRAIVGIIEKFYRGERTEMKARAKRLCKDALEAAVVGSDGVSMVLA